MCVFRNTVFLVMRLKMELYFLIEMELLYFNNIGIFLYKFAVGTIINFLISLGIL